MFVCLRIGFVVLAAFCLIAVSGASVCANTDKITAALAQASKHLEQGVPVQAIETINQAIKSTQVPPDIAAKALLMRAQAQEQIGKYAYALADYNQALWMEGLASTDKSKAEEGRERILTKLGVVDGKGTARVEDRQAPPVTTVAQKRTASAKQGTSSWGTKVQTPPSEEPALGSIGGDIGNFFNNIFGGTNSSAPAEPKEVQPVQPRKAVAAARPRVEPVRTVQALQTAEADPTAASESRSDSASQFSGAFAVQFAALLTEDKAVYEADRVSKRYSEWLNGRTASIVIKPTSDGGTLYKVVVEPYERGEGIATCELLKTKGVNCMLISR